MTRTGVLNQTTNVWHESAREAIEAPDGQSDVNGDGIVIGVWGNCP